MCTRPARFIGGSVLLVVLCSALDAQAIPAWSRKYRTSCSTCHAAHCIRGRAEPELGLRQPCTPVSSRAQLRPR